MLVLLLMTLHLEHSICKVLAGSLADEGMVCLYDSVNATIASGI